MTNTLDIAHLLERPEIHQVYVQRYRANYLMRELHQILHERSRWHVLGTKPSHLESKGDGAGGPPVAGARAYCFADIPDCAFLQIKRHALMLWKSDLQDIMNGLTVNTRGKNYLGLSGLERSEVKAFLALPRYTFPFHEDKRNFRMARNTDYPQELEYAVLKIVDVAEVT